MAGNLFAGKRFPGRGSLTPPYLHARFSAASFFYHAVLVLSLAFFPLAFRAQGFTPAMLGYLGTLSVVASIAGQAAGAILTHRFLPARRLVVLAPIGGMGALLALQASSAAVPIFLFYFVFQSCHAASQPPVDAQVLRGAAEGHFRLERVRMFGSIGFIAGGLVAGAFVDAAGERIIVPLALVSLALLLAAGLAVAPYLPERTDREQHADRGPTEPWPRGNIGFLLLIVLVQWASHASMYLYLSVYLKELGWSARGISVAWNTGVLAEVAVFLLLRPILGRIGLVSLLRVSAALTIVRWLVLSFAESGPVILASQTLHGFSFGGFYIASLQLLDRLLPPHLRSKGPGMLGTLGHSGGSLAGRVVVSLIVAETSDVFDYRSLFRLSAGIAALGFVLALRFREREAGECPRPCSSD